MPPSQPLPAPTQQPPPRSCPRRIRPRLPDPPYPPPPRRQRCRCHSCRKSEGVGGESDYEGYDGRDGVLKAWRRGCKHVAVVTGPLEAPGAGKFWVRGCGGWKPPLWCFFFSRWGGDGRARSSTGLHETGEGCERAEENLASGCDAGGCLGPVGMEGRVGVLGEGDVACEHPYCSLI